MMRHRRRVRRTMLCRSSKDHHQLFPLLLICVTSILASFAVVHAFSASSSSSTATNTPPPPPPPINNNNNNNKVIPITILSGFLGTGKTTLLRNLLQNDKGIKIAVIVNDVADVNIDSKLISQRSGNNKNDDNDKELVPGSQQQQQQRAPAGMVELQNGCACCSLSSELLPAVSELVTLSDMRQDPNEQFDHIVIEMSGVGNPRSVRSNFQQALMYGMPLLDRVRLDTMITVVDCGSFLDHIRSGKAATADDAPELFYRDPDAPRPKSSNKNEDLLSDLPLMLRAALEEANNGNRGYELSQQAEGVGGGVADLLVEQIEIADYVLLNKIDESPNADTIDTIEQIVRALNPRAKTFRTTYGKVDMEQILGAALGMGVVECGVVDDHKDAVLAADEEQQVMLIKKEEDTGASSTDLDHRTDETDSHSSHSHEHNHHHHSSHVDTADTVTTDSNTHDDHHSHSHNHDDEHDESHSSHNSSHDDDHSHSHSHHHDDDDSAAVAGACTDPDCTDQTHTHDHHHNHDHHTHTGIGTYVYRARRPFHPRRLIAFLRHMPVTRGVPPPSSTQDTEMNTEETKEARPIPIISDTVKKTLRSLLRSKGFCWIADSNVAASYWSHAGSSFEMQCLGRWWATLPRDQWPEEAKDTILADFDDPSHGNGDNSVSLLSQSVGDRRQEIVFIGTNIGNHKEQSNICDTLDTCLLTEEEWKSYLSNAGQEDALRKIFANPMQSRVVTY